jgi:predicted transcriptional regulator
MRIAQAPTACAAFHALEKSKTVAQREKIVAHIEKWQGTWSIGELAEALGLQKSTVSARVNELLYETGELIVKPKRKDRISMIVVRPVGLPQKQEELF